MRVVAAAALSRSLEKRKDARSAARASAHVRDAITTDAATSTTCGAVAAKPPHDWALKPSMSSVPAATSSHVTAGTLTMIAHPRVLGRNIFPAREEFTTKAHQDFPNVQGTEEVYTAWIPMIDIPMEAGPLQVAAGTLAQSLAAVAAGGHIAIIGGLSGFGGNIPAASLVGRNAGVTGIFVGSRVFSTM